MRSSERLNEPDRRGRALGRSAAAALLGSALAGAAIVWNPVIATGCLLVGLTLVYALAFQERVPVTYARALTALLVGYAFLGRGFAHVGVAPVYVGEVALALGLVALVLTGRAAAAVRSPVALILVAFALWGAVRTVPFIDDHGISALRDAVLWGYGAFALVVAGLLARRSAFDAVRRRYARWAPRFLLWAPIAGLVFRVARDRLPTAPGADVPLPYFKAGDTATHLAGVAAFLLLGLHRSGRRRRGHRSAREWGFWIVWLLGFLVAASSNRGGLLAGLLALAVVVLLRPSSRWRKLGVVAAGITLLFVGLNLEIDLGGARKVTPQQIALNLRSVVENIPRQNLAGTREWRLLWWGQIVDYTIFGEHFWGGKGFGVNLADDDGFQTTADHSLRSPHNAHLTVLARAGVPGLALWVLLQSAFALALLLAYLRARRAGRDDWARLDLWVLAYWTAFMVNGTFDVFLEGPQGGIWFWCLFGFGLALLEAQGARGAAITRAGVGRPAARYTTRTTPESGGET